jgi:hypothetical protein
MRRFILNNGTWRLHSQACPAGVDRLQGESREGDQGAKFLPPTMTGNTVYLVVIGNKNISGK